MKKIISLMVLLFSITSIDADPLPQESLVSMELDGVPLADALRMIADQNRLNLVIAGNVEGTVTMRLDNVDVPSALDAIVTANGFSYFLKDDIIVVREPADDVSAELASTAVTLKYIDPVTAKTALDSRLSAHGQVLVLDKADRDAGTYAANRIVITEHPNNLPRLVSLVAEMDVPERMVLIEVKIIETKVDSTSKLGFLWPSSVSAEFSGADAGSSTTDVVSVTDNNLGVYAPTDGSWTWGKLSVAQVNTILDLLNRQGNSRLVSDPRITTLENHEAEIAIQRVIPIQTINRFSEGAVIQDIVTFQDEEVGISLKVTPRINEDDRITLEVNPTVEDIIGFTGSADNQKPITTARSIKTRITVNNNETVALGGLYKEDEIKTEQKVPLLGHIPLLGKLLFTHKSTEKTTTDLIILITPRLLD